MYFLNIRPPSAEPHQNLLRHLPETLFRFRAATRAPARLRERLGHYSCRGTCFNPSPRPRAWSRQPNEGEAHTPTQGGVEAHTGVGSQR